MKKLSNELPEHSGQCRAVIERVTPELDAGRYPIKRIVGESITVEADIFADGHDALAAVLKYRHAGAAEWAEVPMQPLVNDRWRAAFRVSETGQYRYTLEAWVDHFHAWQSAVRKKAAAGQELALEFLNGAQLVDAAAERADGPDAELLRNWSRALRGEDILRNAELLEQVLGPGLLAVMTRHPDRRFATRYERELCVTVDPPLAGFGAWYEVFPRSCSPDPGRPGTFKDLEGWLPRVAEMGFDVLYLPPIHPIGRSFRKGKNNRPVSEPDEPGSPWGIGSAEGGHKAIHPELGTLEDFQALVAAARQHHLTIALDIAFQCSPDHPYLREHPEWFRRRADGSIQYAENPPKKYQDIYPINFETEDWRNLWIELKSIFEFWIAQGVPVFRVDNPHTKSLAFWEWVIDALKRDHPDLIFLAEAFTRPKLMYSLAKKGYTQSYNYFPWRNTKWELTEYFTELNQAGLREFFRPNLWPNTPDILTQYLQFGGRSAFMARLVLAATLGASYGIYGPPFELCLNQALEFGSEEYLDSEKYEVRHWDLNAPGNLQEFIGKVNRIRRANVALQRNDNLHFHPVDNEQILAYSKCTDDFDNIILTIVNLDPHHRQTGWVELALDRLGLEAHTPFQVHEMLTGARYLWQGSRNYVELNPTFVPAHILHLRRRIRSERDFDYFL